MNDELIVMSCENSLETFLFGKSGGQTWCLKYTGHDLKTDHLSRFLNGYL